MKPKEYKKYMFEKWWETYQSINSAKFTIENSGNYLREACPYKMCIDKDGIEPSSSEGCTVMGYTLNPPGAESWQRRYDMRTVGIMFEKENGDQVWFHFPIYDEEDYLETQ